VQRDHAHRAPRRELGLPLQHPLGRLAAHERELAWGSVALSLQK
jgi:hypothetical protein